MSIRNNLLKALLLSNINKASIDILYNSKCALTNIDGSKYNKVDYKSPSELFDYMNSTGVDTNDDGEGTCDFFRDTLSGIWYQRNSTPRDATLYTTLKMAAASLQSGGGDDVDVQVECTNTDMVSIECTDKGNNKQDDKVPPISASTQTEVQDNTQSKPPGSSSIAIPTTFKKVILQPNKCIYNPVHEQLYMYDEYHYKIVNNQVKVCLINQEYWFVCNKQYLIIISNSQIPQIRYGIISKESDSGFIIKTMPMNNSNADSIKTFRLSSKEIQEVI